MTDQSTADEAAAQAVLGLTAEPRRDVYFEPPPDESASSSEKPETPREPPRPAPNPEPVEKLAEFDPKHREPFTGMLYVGHLDEKFTLFGHEFLIKTPTARDFIKIGLLIKPFQDSISAEVAFEAARVAAYLVSIDRVPLPEPLDVDPRENSLRERFEWVQDNLRRPVISALFNKVMELENTVSGVLDAMGKV